MLSSVSKGSPCSIINKMEKTQQCNECQSQNKKCLKCGKWLNYKKEEDERKEIARLLFTIFFILFLVIIYNWDKVSSNNVWKIIFCFDFFLLGLTGRARAYYNRAQDSDVTYAITAPWENYVCEYILVGIIGSLFIFSIVSITT